MYHYTLFVLEILTEECVRKNCRNSDVIYERLFLIITHIHTVPNVHILYEVQHFVRFHSKSIKVGIGMSFRVYDRALNCAIVLIVTIINCAHDVNCGVAGFGRGGSRRRCENPPCYKKPVSSNIFVVEISLTKLLNQQGEFDNGDRDINMHLFVHCATLLVFLLYTKSDEKNHQRSTSFFTFKQTIKTCRFACINNCLTNSGCYFNHCYELCNKS